MGKVVLDASVILAVLFEEPGLEGLIEELSDAVVSTVNLSEVVAKLVLRGVDAEDAWTIALGVTEEIVAFDREQAKRAGEMAAETRRAGLSFGDRACLALGVVLDAPVYTTERSWSNIDVGARVRVVR